MSKAFKFNPGFQSDDEAVANFVVRRRELDLALAAFAGGDTPRVLVVAPRGAGKTTLCRRVLAETRRSDALGLCWRAIFLGEESYTVTSPGEFFLECLFQLRDQEPGSDLDEVYDKAVAASDEDELVSSSLDALRAFARKVGRRLLIIVENFHIILHDQIGEGADRLLELLADESLFGVLATSVAQALSDEDRELPLGYRHVILRPLDLEECHALWEALAGQPVKPERIRPLQILTGGSPRLLHILAEFMRTPSLKDLMANLNLLIDQNTEYFKSQLDALPTVERKVFAALLDAWDPKTAKQIAEAARLNTNVASAMLARLSDRGAVIKEQGKGRAAFYYASERLFNIYYLMRRRSHPSSRVRALVSFMTEYYDRDELIDVTVRLVREACAVEPEARSDYHSTFGAIMAKAAEADRQTIIERADKEFIRSFRQDQRTHRQQLAYIAENDDASSPVEDEIPDLIARIEAAVDDEDLDQAERLINEFIERRPYMAEPWLRLSILKLEQEDYVGSAKAARKSLEIDPNDAWGFAVLGSALEKVGERSEAVEALVAALKQEPSNALALVGLSAIREEEGDLAGAIQLYETARPQGNFSDVHWARFGALLQNAGRVQDAEAVLREGVSGSVNNRETRRSLVTLLDETDREDEAIALLKQAATGSDQWELWADLGTFLQIRTDHQAEAVSALKAAIEKGGERLSLYRCLASAEIGAGFERDEVAGIAETVLYRFARSAEAWISAGDIYRSLHDDSKAEAAFRAAIDVGSDYPGRIMLARLLRSKPDRRGEAASLMREAIEKAGGQASCGASREFAELLIHSGDEQEALAVVEEALARNAECACCLVLHGEICARRGEKDAAKRRFSAALDLHDDDIDALTGLARVVDHNEARALLDRAMEIAPGDPRCLATRAQLKIGDAPSQIADAKAALEIDSNYMEALLLLAPLQAMNGELDTALEHLVHALALLENEREFMPAFVSATMAIAQHDRGERVSQLLEANKASGLIEPLLIALQLMRGEQPRVAKEVFEVAKDIVERHSVYGR